MKKNLHYTDFMSAQGTSVKQLSQFDNVYFLPLALILESLSLRAQTLTEKTQRL